MTWSQDVVLLIVGGIAAVIGGVLAIRSLLRCVLWQPATGTVERMDREDGVYFRPTVRFSTRDGQVIFFRSAVAHNHRGYCLGDGVRVLYDPRKPERAEISSFVRLWVPSVFLFVLSAVFFGFHWFAHGGPAAREFARPAGILFVSALLLASAIAICVRVYKRRNWLPAEGTVYRLAELRTRRGQTVYRPFIRFQAADGREFHFESETTTGDNVAFAVGSKVQLIYDPRDPENAVLKVFRASRRRGYSGEAERHLDRLHEGRRPEM